MVKLQGSGKEMGLSRLPWSAGLPRCLQSRRSQPGLSQRYNGEGGLWRREMVSPKEGAEVSASLCGGQVGPARCRSAEPELEGART